MKSRVWDVFFTVLYDLIEEFLTVKIEVYDQNKVPRCNGGVVEVY